MGNVWYQKDVTNLLFTNNYVLIVLKMRYTLNWKTSLSEQALFYEQ